MDDLKLPASDHDLLVELRVNVNNISTDVRELAASVKDNNADHENRLRRIESTYVSWPKVIAMLTALAGIIGALWWVRP